MGFRDDRQALRDRLTSLERDNAELRARNEVIVAERDAALEDLAAAKQTLAAAPFTPPPARLEPDPLVPAAQSADRRARRARIRAVLVGVVFGVAILCLLLFAIGADLVGGASLSAPVSAEQPVQRRA